MTTQKDREITVYVGTYTEAGSPGADKSEGIYRYHLDLSTGALIPIGVTPARLNPSFLALSPNGKNLYAVSEVDEHDGIPGGAVNAYAVDPSTQALTYLNRQHSQGAWPCHVSIDHAGQYVMTANYKNGSVGIYPIQADGSLGEASDAAQHEGSSVNAARQEGPHAHSITPSPDNRFAFVADLGIDKVMVYKLEAGQLLPNETPSVEIHAGAGPRHLAFHPSGKYLYLINELDLTMSVFAYDQASGTLQALQTLSTLPPSTIFDNSMSCADLHVAPSGQFLYGSNRGDDSIVIYAIDQETGLLTYVGNESTQGKTPRNFAIDPTGAFLLAANQDSHTVTTFRIDQVTGELTFTGHVTEVPAPVCIKMI